MGHHELAISSRRWLGSAYCYAAKCPCTMLSLAHTVLGKSSPFLRQYIVVVSNDWQQIPAHVPQVFNCFDVILWRLTQVWSNSSPVCSVRRGGQTAQIGDRLHAITMAVNLLSGPRDNLATETCRFCSNSSKQMKRGRWRSAKSTQAHD